MFYVADLHIHSHYSRATSKELTLDKLYQWAQIKGINVVGTGDFTHPLWYNEIKEKLVPDGTGFFKLKNPPELPALPGVRTKDIDVRFCLSAEISSIYKHDNKVRKNHNVIFAADLDSVLKINARLSSIGNLQSDGRPILGLPSRDLLEIILKSSDDAYLIPAHVWTPWFSTLGSKAGYDSINECFRDLTGHIFALETGLSSDPSMNWRLSELDRYSLVSNSDAHSPQKLGREANIFDTELSYYGMFDALKTKKGFLGTYEFFPEEGKYHLDGHRKCGIVFEPDITAQYNGICPVCKKLLTIGVLHRVEHLADRKKAEKPERSPGFHYLIPLPEIISEIKDSGPASKTVQHIYQSVISEFGNEFAFLRDVPVEDIKKNCGFVLSEAIRRMRENKVSPIPGYDGEFGTIKVFNEGELESLLGQSNLFGFEAEKMTQRTTRQSNLISSTGVTAEKSSEIQELNPEQESVKNSANCALLVKAGPGTGKTGTLIQWIANQVVSCNTKPDEVLAVTFTNKAADEMQTRLRDLLGERSTGIRTGTFHSICYSILQERYPELNTIYDNEGREIVLNILFPELKDVELKKISKSVLKFFELENNSDVGSNEQVARLYREHNRKYNAIDLADIINQTVKLLTDEQEFLEKVRCKYAVIAVDEFQDINPQQYRFIKLIASDKNILVIGDPDQSIYGFRGSDVNLFFKFKEDFNAEEINLERNYRSSEIILKAAGDIIRNNSLKSNLSLKASKNNWKKIKVYNADDTSSETKYILDEIDRYVGGTENLSIGTHSCSGNYSFSDIAVLFRTHFVGKELMRELKKAGIPLHYGDGSSYLEGPPFGIISDVLRLVINAEDFVSLKKVLVNGLEWQTQDVDFLVNNIYSWGSDWTHDKFELQNEQRNKGFEEWQVFYNSLRDKYQSDEMINIIMLICNFFLSDDKLDDLQLIKKEAILSMAEESEDNPEKFLQKMTLGNYSDIGRLKSEGVHLLTFHAAKGLEFPVVFIAGAEENITPVTSRGTSMEEERRLFYVALTRAKDEVHITHSKKRIFYGRTDMMNPSRFISEIGQELKEKVTVEPKRKAIIKEKQLSLF
ncbi:MAG: UvrD-helicase domain-containing protein [Bacteroidales bacterium]|nr:MAG: UvrD-helicase domain-containing protein [Bacteroidales bacterium]